MNDDSIRSYSDTIFEEVHVEENNPNDGSVVKVSDDDTNINNDDDMISLVSTS